MVLINSQIKSEQIFPPDYQIYNVTDNLKLMFYDTGVFYSIVNRNFIPFVEKYDDDNWLLAADATYSAGTISKWLEPTDNELMILAFSMYSDRNMEVRINLPSSDQRFGTKEDGEVLITPEMSPWKNPRVTLYAFGSTWIPSFFIKNVSEYTNAILKFGITGFRYKLEKMAIIPDRFSVVNMGVLKT